MTHKKSRHNRVSTHVCCVSSSECGPINNKDSWTMRICYILWKKMIMWYGCVVDSTNWVDIWQIWKKQLKQKSNINFKEKHSKLHAKQMNYFKSCLRSEVLLSVLSEKARMYVPGAQCPVPSNNLCILVGRQPISI